MPHVNEDGAQPLRVIQWASGGVGRAAIENVLDRPDLDLVGCWVHSADKSGHDVGELVGRDPVGVTATSNADELLALEADCVMYSPLMANDAEVKAILLSGKNVVTPLGWVYPDLTNPKVQAVADAAVAGGRDLARFGHSPRGNHRAVSVDGVVIVDQSHPRSGRGVLRYPHLQLARCSSSRHGFRRDAR